MWYSSVHQEEVALFKVSFSVLSCEYLDKLLNPVRYHRLRASIPANLWRWRTICGWNWSGHHEHINSLEMRAVYTGLRWRIGKKGWLRSRFVHLVDSLVCLHSLARGRSSSRKLRRTLMRINTLLLCLRKSSPLGVCAYIAEPG